MKKITIRQLAYILGMKVPTLRLCLDSFKLAKFRVVEHEKGHKNEYKFCPELIHEIKDYYLCRVLRDSKLDFRNTYLKAVLQCDNIEQQLEQLQVDEEKEVKSLGGIYIPKGDNK